MWNPLLPGTLRRAALVLLASAAPCGCAVNSPASYTAPVAEDIRATARTVAVVSSVAASDDTVARLDVPIGPPQQAAKGAAAGGGAGLIAGVLVSVAGGPLGPVLAPIVIPAFTLGGMAGGTAAGWSRAVPAGDADAANAALRRSRSDMSAEVARRVAALLPSVTKVAASPDDPTAPDLRLEVSIDRWGLAGGAGRDPLVGLFARASYRVAKGADRVVVADGDFIVAGPQRTVSAWTRNGATLLSRAVDETLTRVAATIVDGTFLVRDFDLQPEGNGAMHWAVCGLAPVSPPSKVRFGPYESGRPRVDSLTPRLVWESFPRRNDVEHDTTGVLARVSDVRYDLIVWKGVNGGPGDVVYERKGLALVASKGAVGHTVETPFAPDSDFLWSVRARFRLDGVERVTRWSYDVATDVDSIPLGFVSRHGWSGPEDPYLQAPAKRQTCLQEAIPPLHYFSFSTP